MRGAEVPFSVHPSRGSETVASTSSITAGWSLRYLWREHAYIVPSFFIALLVCGWFVTWGDLKFFERESFCGFYDAQALSMIDGRFDVPPSAIGFEAFTVHGKTYGYFGIGPALLRMPLIILFQKMDGLWSRMMMMLACAINLISAYAILRMIHSRAAPTVSQRLLHALFIICAGIGSTNVFMMGRSFTYHEAIMWGGTFALLFAWTLMKYFQSPNRIMLVLAGIFAFMSLHSRATIGAGAVLAMCVLTAILIWRAFVEPETAQSSLGLGAIAKPLSHAFIAAFAVIIMLSTYVGVNYAKFRTFGGVPLQYYNLYAQKPGRMQLTAGKQIHLENIPTGMATYFGLRGLQLDDQFPWILLSYQPVYIGAPAIDVVEGFSTVPVSMPALMLLALIGCVLLVRSSSETIRRVRLPAITLLVGGSIIFATVGITERYLHDLYPTLIICGAVGVYRIGLGRRVVATATLIAVLSIISVAFNCSFALVNQRVASWGVPVEKRNQFEHFQESIDRVLHR